MNIPPHRACAPEGPPRVRTGYPLEYAPRHKRDPWPWLDTATTIRYSRLEVVEHPLWVAFNTLTPAGRRALAKAEAWVSDDAITGQVHPPKAVVTGRRDAVDALQSRGLVSEVFPAQPRGWCGTLTPDGVDLARLVAHLEREG
jgi:hypothetical protein